MSFEIIMRKGATASRVVLFSVLLVGCAAQTEQYQLTRDISVPSRWAAFAESEPRLIDNGWVASFGSDVLNRLVMDAMASNRDLRAAAARLTEARALARQSGAGVFPTIGAELTATRSGNGTISNTVDATLRAGWEADLWGRLRGETMAAGYEAVAAEAIFEAARQSLAAAVAVAWIEVNGHARSLEISRQELNARRSLLNSIEQGVAAQTILEVEANSARADVARARERVAAAEGELANGLRVLETLTGRYPAGTLNAVSGLPRLPDRVPVGLPAQILERRPDIIAAERGVAAAFYRRNAAQAAQLPRISLSADLTGSGGNLGAALNPEGIVWTLIGNIFAPLVDGGQRAEEVNIRTARQSEALALYGAIALRAFREVETAISDEEVLRRRLGHLNSAATEMERAVATERARFDAGEVELFRLNEARVRYYAALRDANAVRVDLLRNRVALHMALGGSFATLAPIAATEVVAVAVVNQ